MTLEELDRTLPNGFHDAEIRTIHIDYPARRVTMAIAIWLGDMDGVGW